MKMKNYIGTKFVKARPMSREDYNELRGWILPEDENGKDEGMLVEYRDGGVANLKGHRGYVSWSPKEVFDNAYRQDGQFSFGDAVMLMRKGKVVSRTGWNGRRKDGKPMFVQLVEAGEASNEINKPFFVMVHADDSVGVWTPVTNDILAHDWFAVKQ